MAIQEYTPSRSPRLQSLSIRDIAWFAGLLEGEGSFQWHSTPIITIQMTDYDVIERVSQLVEYNVNTYKPRGKATYKQVWGISIAGMHAISWMLTLYPFMGKRRQAKIVELVQCWKKAPGVPRGRKGERLPAFCHPERLRVANGLCKQCYQKEFMQTWRLETKATCHPERTVKGYGLCNPCYLREYRAKLAGKTSLLNSVEHNPQTNTCHPERPHFGLGLCASCYQKQRRETLAQQAQNMKDQLPLIL